MELWNRNVYTDLNGKSQNLETKQIKNYVFSYVFLISNAIVFLLIRTSFKIVRINCDI